jgi:plasmid stability protein
MANLTIVVDDQLLRAARVRAVHEGTSVNEICREAIARFAQAEGDGAARAAKLKALARKAKTLTEPLWPGREALYRESGRGAR